MGDTPFSFIGSADVYMDILDDDGNPTGLALQGDCSQFTPKPDSERKERTGHGRSNYGQVIASATLPKPMTATVVFGQLSAQMFAAAFFATSEAYTQTAGTITPAIAITAIHDRWVEIGLNMVDALVVKDSTDTETYTASGADPDYEVNTRLGMIKALSTGAIADGDVLHVTGNKLAITTGSVMQAMTKANIRVRFKLDGQNYDDGRNFITDVYQMRLNPTSDFSLIGEDFVDVTFEGSLETPAGYTTPMKHVWLS
jgi:hypothetical protein